MAPASYIGTWSADRETGQLTVWHPRLRNPGTGCFCCPWPRPLGDVGHADSRLLCSAQASRGHAPSDSSQHARESMSQSPEPSCLGPNLSTRASFLPSWNLSVLICKMGIITGLTSLGFCEHVMSYHHRKYLALGLAHSKCSIKMLVLNEAPELTSGLTVPSVVSPSGASLALVLCALHDN